MTRAELEAYIAKIDDEQDEDLNWQESIVDLMKLLKLDSSLAARKQLAQKLGYIRRAHRLARNEYLAAQAGDDQGGGRRRQSARQFQDVIRVAFPFAVSGGSTEVTDPPLQV